MVGDRSVVASTEQEARDKLIAELASHAPLTPEDLVLVPENEPPPPLEA